MSIFDNIDYYVADELRAKSRATVAEYISAGIIAIDDRLGEGYARDNPALVAAFMQAASIDFAGTVIAHQVRHLADALAYADLDGNLSTIARNIRGDLPSISEEFYEPEEIARMIDTIAGRMTPDKEGADA